MMPLGHLLNLNLEYVSSRSFWRESLDLPSEMVSIADIERLRLRFGSSSTASSEVRTRILNSAGEQLWLESRRFR
jgi:hypothetical protein